MRGVEYKGLTSVDGPIVIVRRKENISKRSKFNYL